MDRYGDRHIETRKTEINKTVWPRICHKLYTIRCESSFRTNNLIWYIVITKPMKYHSHLYVRVLNLFQRVWWDLSNGENVPTSSTFLCNSLEWIPFSASVFLWTDCSSIFQYWIKLPTITIDFVLRVKVSLLSQRNAIASKSGVLHITDCHCNNYIRIPECTSWLRDVRNNNKILTSGSLIMADLHH